MCEKYNGHKNYETWCVSLWMGEEVNRITDLIKEGKMSHYAGAEQLKAYIIEESPLYGKCSMYADILMANLQQVDWYGLVEP
jgi:hypothetical protein